MERGPLLSVGLSFLLRTLQVREGWTSQKRRNLPKLEIASMLNKLRTVNTTI